MSVHFLPRADANWCLALVEISDYRHQSGETLLFLALPSNVACLSRSRPKATLFHV
jgi:hypothetical protein